MAEDELATSSDREVCYIVRYIGQQGHCSCFAPFAVADCNSRATASLHITPFEHELFVLSEARANREGERSHEHASIEITLLALGSGGGRNQPRRLRWI